MHTSSQDSDWPGTAPGWAILAGHGHDGGSTGHGDRAEAKRLFSVRVIPATRETRRYRLQQRARGTAIQDELANGSSPPFKKARPGDQQSIGYSAPSGLVRNAIRTL